MNDEQTWTFLERPVKLWGPGPWQDEPDRIEWVSAAGYVCLMLRQIGDEEDAKIYGGPGYSGHWCGYVGVPEDHPWPRGLGDMYEIDVHGGITGGGPCDEKSHGFHPMHRRCHTAKPGQPDHLHWYGFDCNHYGSEDFNPMMAGRGEDHRGMFGHYTRTYKDVAYVKIECEKLALQALAAVLVEAGEEVL